MLCPTTLPHRTAPYLHCTAHRTPAPQVAAELHDLIAEDLVKLYPDEINDVRIRVIELQDHVLSMYDRAIGQYTAGEQGSRAGQAAGAAAAVSFPPRVQR